LDGRMYDSKNEPMNKWKIEKMLYKLYVSWSFNYLNYFFILIYCGM
jgi:hypothetical protein